MEKVVEQSTVFQEKVTKIFINRKDTMAVFDINQLKGHGSSTFHRIFVSAGRAETTVTTEWNKFKLGRSADIHTWHRQKMDHHS